MENKEQFAISTPENESGLMINENPTPLTEDLKIVFITGHKGLENEYVEAYADFARRGYLVLSSASFGTIGYDGKDAEELYRQEVRNSIRIASLVYVVNPDGYIDRLAQEDINFAQSLNKEIEYYEENICRDDVYKYIDETYQLTTAKLKEHFGIIELVLKAIENVTFGYRFMSDEEEQKLQWKPREFPESSIPLVRLMMIHSEPILNMYYVNVYLSIYVQENTLHVNVSYPKEDKDRYGQPKESKLWIDMIKFDTIIDARITEGINPISMHITNQILDAVKEEFIKNDKKEKETE